VELLNDAGERSRMAQAAWDLVASTYSWERVTGDFERILFD
jgi:glycosyltransferase involved in cell wall biosynthesis